MRKARGFSRFELVTVIALIGMVLGVLLSRVAYYQEVAEKTAMDYVVISLKSSLRLRMASMMMEGRLQELGSLTSENPMDWLEKKPANYAGELRQVAMDQARDGQWYFDSNNHALIYFVQHGEHFQNDNASRKRIRLQVKLVHDAPTSADGKNASSVIANIKLVPMESYQWFE